jgi:hypothetical protein
LNECISTTKVAASRAVLQQICLTTFKYFPQTVTPNRLVSSLTSLLASAEIKDHPLMEELACDIFMGEFSPKFSTSLAVAAQTMRGTLYSKYYGLDSIYAEFLAEYGAAAEEKPTIQNPFLSTVKKLQARLFKDDGDKAKARRCFLDAVKKLQARLARHEARDTKKGLVAANGEIIEAAQILLTHNLAQLTDAVCSSSSRGESDAGGLLPPGFSWAECAQRCLEELYGMVRRQPAESRRRLQAKKNMAYAYRQFIFFLSQLPGPEQAAFLDDRLMELKDRKRFSEKFEAALGDLFLGPLLALHKGEKTFLTSTGETPRMVLAWYFTWNIPSMERATNET